MTGQRTFRVRPHEKEFFVYLWMIRGLQVTTALEYARAAFKEGRSKNVKSAKRHYNDFQMRWWEEPLQEVTA